MFFLPFSITLECVEEQLSVTRAARSYPDEYDTTFCFLKH
jgi:hypothetical protein